MRTVLLTFFAFHFIIGFSQKNQLPVNPYQQEFANAYAQYPDVPKGVLEAVSFTMTRFHDIKNSVGS